MKKLITLVFSLFITLSLIAQGSKVSENGILKSSILKEDMMFSIYLPPGYETSDRRYPVVYLLHGRTDDNIAWIQFGEMQRIVDKAINNGTITPMIIVTPDAKLTYYMNDVKGNYKYEDYFINEFIPFIEKNYKCRASKEYRGIAGLSMGGYGALLYSLHHPDMFTACSALSAGVRTDDEMITMADDRYFDVYGTILGEAKGKDRITDYYNHNSVLYLVKNMPDSLKTAVHFYIDIGDDDFLYKGNSTLHILMRDLNIPHEYRVRDGKHEWEYWRTGLTEALKFISNDFHR